MLSGTSMTPTREPAMSHELIFTQPLFHEKIWGGRRLQAEYGYDIPAGPIGECWAISAHPSGDCPIARGAYRSMTLSRLWDMHPELFGRTGFDRFPLLVKILDAEGDLSIQVHPDDAYAMAHERGSLGKMECWYVLHAEPDATIVVGQRAHGREEFARLAREDAWDRLLNEVPVRTGDFFQIMPGTVHAIKAGTMVLEIQQSSDVTYRVYDYDRVQADGTQRALHRAQSLDVIDFSQVPPSGGVSHAADGPGVTLLEECARYRVWHVLVGDEAITLPSPRTFYCASVVEGQGAAAGEAVCKGDHLVVPQGFGDLALTGSMELIVSTVPEVP